MMRNQPRSSDNKNQADVPQSNNSQSIWLRIYDYVTNNYGKIFVGLLALSARFVYQQNFQPLTAPDSPPGCDGLVLTRYSTPLSSLSSYSIILLGSAHGSEHEEEQKKLVECIESLAEPGDEVFVESDRTIPIECKNAMPKINKAGVQCRGWDLPRRSSIKKPIREWDFIQGLKELLANKDELMAHLMIKRGVSIEDYKRLSVIILNRLAKNEKLDLILDSLEKEIYPAIAKAARKVTNEMPLRNKALAEILKNSTLSETKTSSKHKKFVIAGTLHVGSRPWKQRFFQPDGHDQGIEVLYNSLKEFEDPNPYAVLIHENCINRETVEAPRGVKL